MNNEIYKKELFSHINGITLIPTLDALIKTNLIDIIINQGSFSINSIHNEKRVNKGYINITIRLLYSMGFLDFKIDNNNELKNIYITNNNLLEIINYKNEIQKISRISQYYINFNKLTKKDIVHFSTLINDIIFILENKNINLNLFFEGIVLGPLLAHLGFNKQLTIKTDDTVEIKDLNSNLISAIIRLFSHFKLLKLINNTPIINNKGKYFFNRLAAYGVTSSYLPMLSRIPDLLIGNFSFIWDRNENNDEIHVNRGMNVWGSGGAHKIYFKKIDNLIKKIFNQDISKQPIGIIDIGCGDGTFLKHVYNIITEHTLRGKCLDTNPLLMVGTDINKAARIATRNKLNKSNINNIIINGNIGNPSEINNLLSNEFNYSLSEFINTRTFLDHNRIFEEPKKTLYKNINTSGAFCYKGNIVSKNKLVNNLINHFKRWSPFIKTHGLILLELHTINPKTTRKNINRTLAPAYDATHGYSDQYLVEHNVFIECLEKSNIKLYKEDTVLFPNNNMATVSINFVK